MFKCKYCGWIGTQKDFEHDHPIPIARSLLYNLLNPQTELICSGCNREKGKKTAEEYTLWRIINKKTANFGPIPS